MSAQELIPEATCKDSLQVHSKAGCQRTVPEWHRGSVVKKFLTTELGARAGCVATIKENLMLAQPLLPEAGAMDASDLRALEELEEQIKHKRKES
jgi:hypothetical protein